MAVSFVHNQECLEKLCTVLKPSFGGPAERLAAAWLLVRELHKVDLESIEQTKLETIIAAGRALCTHAPEPDRTHSMI